MLTERSKQTTERVLSALRAGASTCPSIAEAGRVHPATCAAHLAMLRRRGFVRITGKRNLHSRTGGATSFEYKLTNAGASFLEERKRGAA
jgi:predicted ArsR family transcriptional regulator